MPSMISVIQTIKNSLSYNIIFESQSLNTHTVLFKDLGSKQFFSYSMFWKKSLLCNKATLTVILWTIFTNKITFFLFKCNLFLWWQTWFFSRNQSNMLICCSRNISYFFQCYTNRFIFLWKLEIHFFFQDSLTKK